MNLASWNTRGLNDPLKWKKVRHLTSKNKVSLWSLVETKVNSNNVEKFFNKCFGPSWNLAHNTNLCNGRIWVVCDRDVVEVSALEVSNQVILSRVTEKESEKCFYLASVYAFNDGTRRRELWQRLKASINHDSPWILAGDFNKIRNREERSTDRAGTSQGMSDFNDCIRVLQLEEPSTTGSFFTWFSGRGDGPMIRSRIDCCLVNGPMLDIFPYTAIFVSVPNLSDHSPLLVNLGAAMHHRKPFKFFNFWVKDKDFHDMVK